MTQLVCNLIEFFVIYYVNRNEIKDLGEKYRKLETILKENEENSKKTIEEIKQKNDKLQSDITNVKQKFLAIEQKNTSMMQITSEKK